MPQQTRVYDNRTTLGSTVPGAVLLPPQLARAGYSTQLIGKVNHHFTAAPQPAPSKAQRGHHARRRCRARHQTIRPLRSRSTQVSASRMEPRLERIMRDSSSRLPAPPMS